MIAKLRLKQSDMYENLVGAKEISKMLVSFVEGNDHPLAIGAEQGGIENWDDFVIQENLKFKKHIQIKRKTSNFGSDLDECERNTIKRKSGIIEPRDLSELDKAIRSLGIWINSKKNDDESKRKFHLVVLDGGVEIKKGFKIRDLMNIKETHFRTNISTPEGFQSLCDYDTTMKKCECWLRSWCDIKDYIQINELFKILSIGYYNTESDLKAETKEILSRVFKDSLVDEVYSQIIGYTSENSTFTGAITPRPLLFILKDKLRIEVKRWTKFKYDGVNWNVTGIHDLESCDEIERPSVIVPSMWTAINPNSRSLKIDGTCMDNCQVSKSLMRISLHPQGSFDIFCTDRSSWVNSIRSYIGGTLGISDNDLADLRLLDGLDNYSQSDQKVLSNIAEQKTFAQNMQEEMYSTTLKLVSQKLVIKFQQMNSGELCNKVESRWNRWKEILEGDIHEVKELFSRILHPQAEGESISGEFRVGPRTVELLKETIFILLVTSVCLSDDNQSTWKSVNDTLKVSAIGLAYWSGPASGLKKVIQIDDETGVSKLLENESGDIIIIAQSKCRSSEIFNDSIFGSMPNNVLLTQPRYPKLLITQDREFRKMIENSDIDVLKEFFQNKLNKYQSSIRNAVNEVVNEN